MFRNEREFADHAVRALQAEGFAIQREVPVRGRRRLDIVASKEGLKRGIEVKFNSRGLRDDIMKAHAILRLPEVDEMYVCGPKVFMSEDVRALATKLGVGLLAMSDAGELHWLADSRRLEPPRLIIGGGYGSSYAGFVRPGGVAAWNTAVFNNGQKAAVDVEVFMVTAGPFAARPRSKARARTPLIDGGGKWLVTLGCRVKEGTRPGTYPLLISVTAENAPRDDDTVPYEVRQA
jgi:hypothetical protein